MPASSSPSPSNCVINKPSVIDYKHYRFIVHDAPTDSNLPGYVEYALKKRAVALVRACEPTYDKGPLESAGIRVVECAFQDGSPPPDQTIHTWMKVVREVFDGEGNGKSKSKSSGKNKDGSSKKDGDKKSQPSICVHCVAGLGRAPVLVCIALIELGMNWMSAVELVRKKRRGALNTTQLKYLETYKPKCKKDKDCVIM